MSADAPAELSWSDLSPRRRKRITDQVFEVKGTTCTLRLSRCTVKATTVDHIVPNKQTRCHDIDNLEPACLACNQQRGDRSTGGDGRFGATVVVVCGPPGAGKSTWVYSQASPSDVIVDHDALCVALMGPGADGHQAPTHVRAVAAAMRGEAIHAASRLPLAVTVWVIHSLPGPADLAAYRRRGWRLVVVDPGEVETRARLAAREGQQLLPRVAAGVSRWYRAPIVDPGRSGPAAKLTQPSRAW